MSSKPTQLFVFQHPPYGCSLSREGIDALLASAAFEQPCKVLFVGDGVFNLLKDQQAKTLNARNLAQNLRALAMYDVDEIYASDEDVMQRQLQREDFCIPVQLITDSTIQQMFVDADITHSF